MASSREGGGASAGGGGVAAGNTGKKTDEKTDEEVATGGFQVVTKPLTAKDLALFFKPRRGATPAVEEEATGDIATAGDEVYSDTWLSRVWIALN